MSNQVASSHEYDEGPQCTESSTFWNSMLRTFTWAYQRVSHILADLKRLYIMTCYIFE